MAVFRDAEGRTWEVRVTAPLIKRVRGIGIDLADPKAASDKLNDPVAVVEAAYLLVMDKADERGVTEDQFGAALVGDVLADAYNAVLEAMIDFFPSRETRDRARRAMEIARKVQQEEAKKAGTDEELEAKIRAEIQRRTSVTTL